MAGIGKVTGLTEFAVELEVAASRMIPEVTAVTSKGCLNIKQDWARSWASLGKHLPMLGRSVSYDVTVLPGRIVGDVGPDLNRRQGPLGGIAEFGTPTSAPHPGGSPALDREAPKFEQALAALTAKLLP